MYCILLFLAKMKYHSYLISENIILFLFFFHYSYPQKHVVMVVYNSSYCKVRFTAKFTQ